jgi:hypothetical protein
MVRHIQGARRIATARRFIAITGAVLVAPVIGLVGASSALATPKGIFAPFADCPATTSGVALCQFAQTTSGSVAIGKTSVPISKTITLQGGATPTGVLNEYLLVPAKDGNSLSKTELNVPGGLADLINCEEIKGSGFVEKLERETCKALFESGTTGVTATTELVANSSNPAILNTGALFASEQTALVLPVRVHLKNPLLGSGCYIGSEASPIQLHLTTGTTKPALPNKPIKGKVGTLGVEEEFGFEVDTLTENALVDNNFSAPVAEGCGELLSFLIDPIVDSKLGLPSAAGNNTAILEGSLKVAEAAGVIASE